jgi:hypothetical protein
MEEQDVCAKSGVIFIPMIEYCTESLYLVGVVLEVSERAREVGITDCHRCRLDDLRIDVVKHGMFGRLCSVHEGYIARPN